MFIGEDHVLVKIEESDMEKQVILWVIEKML